MEWMARIWIALMMLTVLFLGTVLGRLWAEEQNTSEIVVKNVPAKGTQETRTKDSESQESRAKRKFVASRNGEKYYPLDCSAYERIHKENRVYFATQKRAKDSGRELSELCK